MYFAIYCKQLEQNFSVRISKHLASFHAGAVSSGIADSQDRQKQSFIFVNCSGVFRISQREIPNPPLPPSFLPLPSFPSLLLFLPYPPSIPSPPFPGALPLIRLGGLGERSSSPSGSEQRRFLVHFRLKRTLLVTCATFAVLKCESSSLKKSRRSVIRVRVKGLGFRGHKGPLNTPLCISIVDI